MPRNTAVAIRVEGLNAVVRGLLAIGLEVDDLKDAFSKIAAFGAKAAATAAPVGSGNDPHPGQLRGDIRGNRARNKAVVTAGRVRVPYAAPINYGWDARNIAPALFMQKADQATQPYALRILERDINFSIRRRGLA